MNTKEEQEESKRLLKKLELFLHAIDDVYPSYKKLMLRSFLRGVFIGLGTTIGVSIVLTALTYTLSQLRLIPAFEQLFPDRAIEQIIEYN